MLNQRYIVVVGVLVLCVFVWFSIISKSQRGEETDKDVAANYQETEEKTNVKNMDATKMVQANGKTVKESLKIEYDLDGLLAIELYIKKEFEEKSREEVLNSNLVSLFGSFLGETVIANYGGQWAFDPENRLYVEFDSENGVYPISKMRRYFEEGNQESFVNFYQDIPLLHPNQMKP